MAMITRLDHKGEDDAGHVVFDYRWYLNDVRVAASCLGQKALLFSFPRLDCTSSGDPRWTSIAEDYLAVTVGE